MRSRSKIIIALVILVVLAVAFTTIVSVGNRILKNQLEKALGENFRVAHIGLSWGGVTAVGVELLRDGKVVASVKRLGLKADFLTIFRKTIEVSQVTLEEPIAHLEVDQNGTLLLPSFPQAETAAHERGTPGKTSRRSVFAVYLRRIELKNGSLTLRDRRLKDLNEIQASQINLTLSNFRFPLADEVSKVKADMKLAGPLISGGIALDGSIDLLRTGFNIALEADNVAAVNLAGDGPQLRIEKMTLHASSQGSEEKIIEVSDLILQKFYVRAQIDRQGKLVNPLLHVLQSQAAPPASVSSSSQERKPEPTARPTQFNVKGLKISEGEALILNSKVSTPPHQIRLTDIALTADQFASPLQDTVTTFQCSLSVPGKDSTGLFRASGKSKLKSLDTNGKVSLHGLDMLAVKPYIMKAGDVDLTRGTINLDVDLHIDKRRLDSPAKAVLRNLQFAPSKGSGERFMAIPRSAVTDFLKANNNEIALDFVVTGNIDDLSFSLRETMATRFALQLAQMLGLGSVTAGQSLIDVEGKGLKNLGDTLKETSKSLRKLFGK